MPSRYTPPPPTPPYTQSSPPPPAPPMILPESDSDSAAKPRRDRIRKPQRQHRLRLHRPLRPLCIHHNRNNLDPAVVIRIGVRRNNPTPTFPLESLPSAAPPAARNKTHRINMPKPRRHQRPQIICLNLRLPSSLAAPARHPADTHDNLHQVTHLHPRRSQALHFVIHTSLRCS